MKNTHFTVSSKCPFSNVVYRFPLYMLQHVLYMLAGKLVEIGHFQVTVQTVTNIQQDMHKKSLYKERAKEAGA